MHSENLKPFGKNVINLKNLNYWIRTEVVKKTCSPTVAEKAQKY